MDDGPNFYPPLAVPPTVPPASPPLLEYANSGPGRGRPEPAGLRAAFFAMSLVAAASAFLPFAFDTSPWAVVTSPRAWQESLDLFLLALPFFAATIAAAWKLRLLVSPRLGRSERRAAYAVAGALTAPTLFVVAQSLWRGDASGDPWEVAKLLSGPTVAAAGAALAVWHALRRRGHRAATTALDTAFAANAVLLLLAFAGSVEVGYKVTAAAVLLIVLEAAVAAGRALRAK